MMNVELNLIWVINRELKDKKATLPVRLPLKERLKFLFCRTWNVNMEVVVLSEIPITGAISEATILDEFWGGNERYSEM